MNIANIEFDEEVDFTEQMEHFTDISSLNPIPNLRIIYKTLTGIGATYSEIKAKRSSIIVLPHISIVISKHTRHVEEDDTLAIYGNITPEEIRAYLAKDSEYAKLLTTPKGLSKVIKVINSISEDYPHIDYRNMFFLLIDECHKVIKDADYRTDMFEVMEHFFQFQNKAMISATPIPPSDPRFKLAGFKHIKVVPKIKFKQSVELIPVISLVDGMNEYLRSNIVEHYCIFFNSIEGIKHLITQLNIQDRYKIFCSQESVKVLLHDGETNTSWKFDDFTKYNFFTSSFFNGLDIDLTVKPNIIILTDCGYREHTILDPYTDILQIIGRFRKQPNSKKDEWPYNKITHINNAKNFTHPISESKAKLRIEQSKLVYEQIETLRSSTVVDAHRELFKQALLTVKPYSRLLKQDGELSYFFLDNYLDNERVKNYYRNPSALRTAYQDTKLYDATQERDSYLNEAFSRLKKGSIRLSPTMNKLVADALTELEEYAGLEIYHHHRDEINKHFFFMVEAYDRLGYKVIESLRFKKRLIELELLKLDVEAGKNDTPIINLVYTSFILNKYYTAEEIKSKLQEIYDFFSLMAVGKATDIIKYFEHRTSWKRINGVNTRVYIFISKKLFQIERKKHI